MMKRCLNTYSELWILFLVDRLAKIAALRLFQKPLEVTSFLSLELHFNKGVSWSLFADSGLWGYFAIITASGALLYFFAWYIYKRRAQGYCTMGELLVLIGGTSNLLDRIRYEGVIDYIHFHIGSWSYPVFNLADVFIVTGIVYMIWRPYHES